MEYLIFHYIINYIFTMDCNIDLDFLGHANNKHYFDLLNFKLKIRKYDFNIIIKFYYYICGKI